MAYRKPPTSSEGIGDSGLDSRYIVERSLGDSLYTARKMVSVPQNDGKHSSEGLTTKGLNGCIALISRTQNGKFVQGIMTHYDPTNLEPHLQKMEELLDSYADDLQQGDTKAALFHPKIGESVDELARKVKNGFERLSGKDGVVKMIPYPIEQEHVLFTGTEGVLNFDVITGKYDFQPFAAREGYNPDFHSFL
tara:strand:- start:65 stop:643 length:579 start_codon:yes stop_codon:yes gene_type:complete